MNREPTTNPLPTLRSAAPSVRAAVPPLVPVVLPLVVAAIALSILFARLFPGGGRTAPQVRFTDITEQARLAFAPWRENTDSPTTLGSGIAVLDFDNDGHADLFFVSGTEWPWEEALGKRPGRGSLALFRNDGTPGAPGFTDVTAIAGLNVALQGMSAAAGDFDGDGLVDLYVTCVGTNHLFRNRGNGRFEDVTEQAGVGGDANTWSTGAAWFDIDGDGQLDLVVAHYARWPEEVGLSQALLVADIGRSYGAPTGFISAFPTVYRNLGGGRFERVADSAGVRDIDPATGMPVAYPLAVVPVDANGDTRLDLLISYHTGASALFLNDGSGRFQKSAVSPTARQEGASASLASASAASFAAEGGVDERSRVLLSLVADGASVEEGAPAALAAKFGFAVADLDLGGHCEVISGEGRAERAVNKFDTGRDFAAAPGVRWHDGASWQPAPAGDDSAWAQPLVARGVAVADFDGDGDPDIVVTQSGGPPRLLRNDQRLGQPWLRVQLKSAHSGSDAIGARVELYTPRRVTTQTVAPAMGLFAQSESTLTFGLGEDARVRRIVVHWPSGARQEVRPPAVNTLFVIHEL